MASYIAFEGGEGSGKSTQAALVAERLDATLTREPGATALGVELRRLLLGSGEWTVGARAEALMMAADRAQHLDEVVMPSLAAG
ncbi:MAG: dTMP kinase, partial [Actinomycetota bacterium]